MTKTIGATTALTSLLNSGTDFVMADLYSFTTNGGTTLNYSGAPAPLTFSGVTWQLGPALERGKISTKLGVEVATLEITISSGPNDTVNGVPWVQFILGLGLDNGTLVLHRAFLANWAAPYTIVGTLIAFSGRVTSIKDVSDTSMTMTVSSWLVLTNVNMGPDVFQAPCLNTLYDGACLANKASFTTTGAVAGSAMTTTSFDTNLTAADAYYSQGQMTFTSGANAGLSRAVKAYLNAAGAITLVLPLPAAPAAGDAFTISAGCDLTMATCTSRFNNLIHFRGQPFTPPAITAAQGPA